MVIFISLSEPQFLTKLKNKCGTLTWVLRGVVNTTLKEVCKGNALSKSKAEFVEPLSVVKQKLHTISCGKECG